MRPPFSERSVAMNSRNFEPPDCQFEIEKPAAKTSGKWTVRIPSRVKNDFLV